MTYHAMTELRNSPGLQARLVACAAQEDIPNPEFWVASNIWPLVKSQAWVDAWQYCKDTMTVNDNPDIGSRDDVINDNMILSSVQAVNTPPA